MTYMENEVPLSIPEASALALHLIEAADAEIDGTELTEQWRKATVDWIKFLQTRIRKVGGTNPGMN
jgi:hypothetical protein